MAQTTLLSQIDRTETYPKLISVSAPNNNFYLTLNTDSWTEQMLAELPCIRFDIYIEKSGTYLRYQTVSACLGAYDPKSNNTDSLDFCQKFYDVPSSFYISITPIFDNNAIEAHNLLIENGIESGTLWTDPTNTFDIEITSITQGTAPVPPTPPQTTITGVPPIQFNSSDGSALTAWEIFGNMVSGTPAQVCGDKTENILPPAAAETKTLNGCTVISDGEGKYTILASGGVSNTEILFDIVESTMPSNPSSMMALYNSAAVNVQILFYYGASMVDYWGMNQNAYRTTAIGSDMASKAFNKVGFKFLDTDVQEITAQPEILTLTSVPTDFIPYGYKIPVTLAGTTENIYITEPIRKALDNSGKVDSISSTGTLTRNVDNNGDALVTPTTETVTVPTLTPATGSNTLSIGTTLQPSSVSITGKISET